MIQDLLRESLADAGYSIVQAFDGEQAIKLLDSRDTHFRALITDVNLRSQVTGWDVARHAREITPELPVVYVTATPDEWQSKGVPNSIVIPKPFAPAQVVTAVSQLLNVVKTPTT